ncbi:hypothetical protein MJ579_18140 [Klebsiella pneumoniae]|nr:hypothetical protein MJ579_18140 [Klebsiella pneumoniae]
MTVLKTYQPQLEKVSPGWRADPRWQPGNAMSGADGGPARCSAACTGTIATPRVESWLDDVKTAKQPESSGNRDLSRPALSYAPPPAGISARMDQSQQLATIRTTSIVPVDLNTMFHLEKTLARANEHPGTAALRRYDALANCRPPAGHREIPVGTIKGISTPTTI